MIVNLNTKNISLSEIKKKNPQMILIIVSNTEAVERLSANQIPLNKAPFFNERVRYERSGFKIQMGME